MYHFWISLQAHSSPTSNQEPGELPTAFVEIMSLKNPLFKVKLLRVFDALVLSSFIL